MSGDHAWHRGCNCFADLFILFRTRSADLNRPSPEPASGSSMTGEPSSSLTSKLISISFNSTIDCRLPVARERDLVVRRARASHVYRLKNRAAAFRPLFQTGNRSLLAVPPDLPGLDDGHVELARSSIRICDGVRSRSRRPRRHFRHPALCAATVCSAAPDRSGLRHPPRPAPSPRNAPLISSGSTAASTASTAAWATCFVIPASPAARSTVSVFLHSLAPVIFRPIVAVLRSPLPPRSAEMGSSAPPIEPVPNP